MSRTFIEIYKENRNQEELDEALFGLIKEYAAYKYNYKLGPKTTISGVGEVESKDGGEIKIKKVGFEIFTNAKGETFKIVPRDRTITSKEANVKLIPKKDFEGYVEVYKKYPLAKEVVV